MIWRRLAKARKGIGRDRRGSIEGLPLQLMMMVLIAGLGSAMVIGWMGDVQTPTAIGDVATDANEVIMTDPDGDGLYSGTFNMTGDMQVAFFSSLATFTVIGATLLWHRIRIGMLAEKVEQLKMKLYE